MLKRFGAGLVRAAAFGVFRFDFPRLVGVGEIFGAFFLKLAVSECFQFGEAFGVVLSDEGGDFFSADFDPREVIFF